MAWVCTAPLVSPETGLVHLYGTLQGRRSFSGVVAPGRALTHVLSRGESGIDVHCSASRPRCRVDAACVQV